MDIFVSRKAPLGFGTAKGLKTAQTATTTIPKGTISLDELQQEVEKLLALLKDRQPGQLTWHGFMVERLTRLNTLTSIALCKK